MAKRSLKASEVGIKKAKQAFRRTGWTQEYLASAVGLETRQSIWKFFSGRPIERHLFIDVCFQLNLEWEDIVAPPDEEEEIEVAVSEALAESDHSLQTLRSRLKPTIQTQCGLLQISLDTAHPLAVEQIYTSVRVLPTPSSQRWLEVANLQAEESGDRGSTQKGTSIPIEDMLATHNKLVILGKPGAGKTTLLQYLATQCVLGDASVDRLPIFISLRTFALEARTNGDLSLETQIGEQWKAAGLEPSQISSLLQSGKGLVLLDGLDEVPRQDSHPLSYQIQKFAETYPQTTILITCRLAAQDYQFRGFTYIELADFDPYQIATVARKWFVAMSQGQQGNPVVQSVLKLECDSTAMAKAEAIGLAKAEQFLQHLDRPENEPIREMVTTPLLLHLACLVFYERAMFPTKRAKLYQAGLDILLVRWDNVRGIQRDLGTHSISPRDVKSVEPDCLDTL
ncbi:MAG: NACHT domain-containing NTPase [Leptolyngbya sp. BL-A-14]